MFTLPTQILLPCVYGGFLILVCGGVYLLVEALRVRRAAAHLAIQKLVRALVVVVVIELYSLAVLGYAFSQFFTAGLYLLLPLMALWIICIMYAAFAVRSVRHHVSGVRK